MIRTISLLFLVIVFAGRVNAQQGPVVQEYINTYWHLAVDEMQRTGVPAAIKLAQGIHETEAGQSELVMKSNNHFGIKCKTGWQGEKVYHDDDSRGECFRAYSDPSESYRDHSDFLRDNQRYAFLFQLDPTDYKGWAFGLKKAGYATNFKYSQILINLIETYELQQYSLIAMGKLPMPSTVESRPKIPTITENSVVTVPEVKKATPISTPVVYPSGIFEINNSRVAFVKGGTSLRAFAEENHLKLSRLLEYNDITPGQGDILTEDQLIFLQRKHKTGSTAFHTVQAEETIYDIAQAEGIRYESILELNHMVGGDEPLAGQRIYLKEKAPGRPALIGNQVKLTSNPEQSVISQTKHIVQNKETLYGISKRYGVSQEKIREWNKLDTATLRPGQELIIYTN